MKTIVLAAGYATRLYPLTEHFPKPLLQIGDNTILGRLLDDIDTISEVTEHIIVTNGKFAAVFEDWGAERMEEQDHGRLRASKAVVSSAAKPIRVLNDGTNTNETRLGAVRDLILAIETFGLDEDLLVVAADNVLDFSLGAFVEAFHRCGTSLVMCYHEPSLDRLRRTGVIEVDAQMRVLRMLEKPADPPSHWAVPPFYLYRREDLPLIKGAIEGGCGVDAPGNLARDLVGASEVHAWPMPAGRFDIGSLDTYEEAKKKYA